MPRCYMVKKQCNKYQSVIRECWGSAPSEGSSSPSSPTEACVAPPYYSPLETQPSYLHQYVPQQPRAESPLPRSDTSDAGSSIYPTRSIEETEAAHDLLSLSQSLPPLPAPGVVIIQHVIPTCCRPRSPVMQEMTSTAYVVDTTTPPSPRPPTPVDINYHNASPTTVEVSCYLTQSPGAPPLVPLTPPASEYSSDAENNNSYELQPNVVTSTTTPNEKVVYTYDALLVTDGRSKNKQTKRPPSPTSAEPTPVGNVEADGAAGANGGRNATRYVCTECGKQYATSSNLSRHKQTHRSLDSQSAKKCMTCGKAYVSMPALAMHVLTHKLAHSCGVCGKLFSRPWLLQGHLRSHTGEKPYGCAHCGKAFADRSNLRAHMQTHSHDKNFECARCRKSFALKSYLNKHLESACLKDDNALAAAVPPLAEDANIDITA